MAQPSPKYEVNPLSKLSKDDLIKLLGAKEQEIEKLKGSVLLSTDTDIVAIRTTITTLAKKKKVKSYEILEVVAKALKVKANIQRPERSPAKYQHPQNMRKTWSGKGAKPEWLKQILEQGKKLEDLLIS